MKGIQITQRKKHLQWMFSFIVACFLFSVSLSAQNYPPLVSVAQAETMLASEIPALEYAMNNTTPGSPSFFLAQRKYYMYRQAWEYVFSGKSVEEGLTSAFVEFSQDANGNSRNEDELPPLSKTGPDYGDQVFDTLVIFLAE